MSNQSTTFATNLDDYLNTTIIFGEIKKTIISKDFRGGDVHIVFGSTEMDFTYADLRGVVVLNISQAFAETILTVPKDWRIETDMTHVLSTEDDKRRDLGQTRNSDKVLVVTGTSAFANLKIVHCA